MARPCLCGSGLPSRNLFDAAMIYVTRVCDMCERHVRAKYNPAIFKPGTFYSVSGSEEDIGREDNE